MFVRVVKEDSAETVKPWVRATMGEGQTWGIQLEKVPAGGFYRIETCLQINGNEVTEWAIRGDMIHHVGIGDLWVIAGQSNADGYGRGPVNDPPELGIHLFRNNGQWDLATHPFNESTATLHVENRERANPGHSPFLGVVWYQGCSDCNPKESNTYAERFGQMVDCWRHDAEDANLPL